MGRLTETASLDDLENEVILVEVMLETLERDDDNYEAQRADLEEYLGVLRCWKRKLTGEQPATSESQFSASPYVLPDWSHSTTIPFQSFAKDGSSDSRKRLHDGLSVPTSKYRRTSASTTDSETYTSASQDSLAQEERALEQTLGAAFSCGNQSYIQRAKRLEEQCAREKTDAEFAKLLSSQPHAGLSTLPNNMTQARLGRDGRFQRTPNIMPASASMSNAQIKSESGYFGPQASNYFPYAGSQQVRTSTKPQHIWDTTRALRTGEVPERTYNDDSSDLEEISAADFSSHRKAVPDSRSSVIVTKHDPYASIQHTTSVNPLPYSTPGISNVAPNGYFQAGDSIYTHHPHSMQSQFENMTDNFMNGSSLLSSVRNVMGQAASTFRPILDDLSTLTGLVGGYSGSIATPEYDLDDDLDARGWGHLLNDPAKTREELEALLRNIRPDEDLPPEMRIDTPVAMQFPLMEHQKLGLSWLKAQEEGTNKGGILADDMGLGKTIQAIALIVSRPSDEPARKTTLIIGPVSLMRQWEREIEIKLRKRYALHVFLYHGQNKKASFAKLSTFNVVLTTFGTVAAEYTRKLEWEAKTKAYPNMRPDAKDKFALLGDESRWYRVIIDEAQYIKNKNTKSARAVSHLNSIYRLCMTGTPMMNHVTELYSLIHFLRIPPYNSYEKFMITFGKPLKSSNEQMRQRAMKTFQALLKAILLRRNKKSEIDGKPILTLPERTTVIRHAIFSEDEDAFYKALETKTQLQVNKYLKAGTFGKNYSNILVLLLRLRQACCHPHLIKDHGVAGGGEVPPEEMEDLCRKLGESTISRIKEVDGAFECPVCYDAVENPTIFFPCGHDVCSECFARMTDPSQAVADGSDSVNAKCPECRGKVEPKRVLNYMTFKKVHLPEKYEADTGESLARVDREDEMSGSEVDSDSEGAEDDDSDADSQGDLRDFIVRDDEPEDADTAEDARGASDAEASKKAKAVRHRKGKGKKSEPTKTLAMLKKEAQRNLKAKKRYLRRLRREWVTSAKIEKTLEILRSVRDNDVREKTIIFSQFTSLLDLLEVPMDVEGWNYRRYDGSMSAKLRNDAVVDFMEKPEVKVMLVSLKAGNAGLNLTEASQVIILDPFWNPFVEEQAIDRAHRIGQQRPVHVHRVLVENSVEDRICALQERKRTLINEALDEKASQSLSRLGQRELAYLFGIDRTLNAD